MGFEGEELYQNDTAQDVKDEFEELFRAGKTSQEITDKLIRDYRCLWDDEEEEPLFWLALADAQWNHGELLPFVLEKALLWIDKDEKSKKKWDALRKELVSPQPTVKKTTKKRMYRCQWKLGDVYAYRLESDLAKEKGLYGRYFLIQKVDEGSWSPEHIVPIVYLKITADTNLPKNTEEYNRLEYVQTWFTRYEDRFLPIDFSCPREDVERKSKMDYQVDEYGFLPQYRIRLLNTSKRVIPTSLIYIGNFHDAVKPEREFVPHVKANIIAVSWKSCHQTFETEMIRQYCGHNLRELVIYKKT